MQARSRLALASISALAALLCAGCPTGKAQQSDARGLRDQVVDSRRVEGPPRDGPTARDGAPSERGAETADDGATETSPADAPADGLADARALDATADSADSSVDVATPDATVDAPVATQTVAIPTTSAAASATGGFSTLSEPTGRTYQVVIGASALGALPAGARIVALAFRQTSWFSASAGPPAAASCPSFDVTLSSSNNAPGALSSSFAANIGSDAVTVRSGALSIAAQSYPGGASHPTPNGFGADITFSSSYTYGGGDLLITVRHNGCTRTLLFDSGSPLCSACQGQSATGYQATSRSGFSSAMVTRLRYAP